MNDQLLHSTEERAHAVIGNAKSLHEIKALRAQYLGRADGEVTLLLRSLAHMPLEERKKFGPLLHALKEKIEQALDAQERMRMAGNTKEFDATLPPLMPHAGSIHPLTQIRWQLEDLFTRMGFIIEDGPEVESEWYNFDALNMPSWHPARDMQDTFYVEVESLSSHKVESRGAASSRLVLRTQTSPVQIRAMEKYGVPLRCIVPGQVYRNEATDARHENTFWQIEGLMIDKDISLAHLNAVARIFLKELFGDKVEMRVRPGYFPFTEPSVEMDITCKICHGRGFMGQKPPLTPPSQGGDDRLSPPYEGGARVGSRCPVCKGTGWLEFMGAGLVRAQEWWRRSEKIFRICLWFWTHTPRHDEVRDQRRAYDGKWGHEIFGAVLENKIGRTHIESPRI